MQTYTFEVDGGNEILSQRVLCERTSL